jgi:hypothetical protein
VLGPLLDLQYFLDVEMRLGFDVVEVYFRDETECAIGFADGDFDFEPFLEAVVVFPDANHAGSGVACDHIAFIT